MNSFKYLQPITLKEASEILLKESSNAVVFSGGTDLLGMIKSGLAAPGKVVNLKSIPGLKKITYSEGKGLQIGALATLAEIAEHPLISEKYTVLSQAANQVASPQLRNLGTIAGNLCQRPRCWYFREDFNCIRKGGDTCYAFEGQNKYHCLTGGGPCFIVHPSDMAVALLALDARLSIFSGKATRIAALKDFFVLPDSDHLHENILKPGEIITEITVPELKANTKSRYIKFREREAWDFAVVSVAVVVQKSGSVIESGKITYGGLSPKPWQDESLNLKLKGLQAGEDNLDRFVKELLIKAEPLSMNSYKIPLARNLTKRILMDVIE